MPCAPLPFLSRLFLLLRGCPAFCRVWQNQAVVYSWISICQCRLHITPFSLFRGLAPQSIICLHLFLSFKSIGRLWRDEGKKQADTAYGYRAAQREGISTADLGFIHVEGLLFKTNNTGNGSTFKGNFWAGVISRAALNIHIRGMDSFFKKARWKATGTFKVRLLSFSASILLKTGNPAGRTIQLMAYYFRHADASPETIPRHRWHFWWSFIHTYSTTRSCILSFDSFIRISAAFSEAAN